MTMYAGEELKIIVTAKDFDSSTILSNDDVSVTSITIYDSSLAVVVDDQPLLWDSSVASWSYRWNTASLNPGTYRAKITLTGLDDGDSIEWKRVRLARQPVTA